MRKYTLGLLAAVLPALAQARGEVRGSVVDARGGEALSHVAIQLVGGTYRATTDDKGLFRIPSVAPGDYTLNVSTVGYHLLKRPFHLDAGEIKEFEVFLSPDTQRQTDTVEVQAGPFETARQDSPAALVLAGNDAKNLASVLADVIPMHCSGMTFYEVAKQEMPGRVLLSSTGTRFTFGA